MNSRIRPLPATSFQYDANSRVTRVTLPDGGQWNYTWTDVGQMETATDPLSRLWSFEYDDASRRTCELGPDPDGAIRRACRPSSGSPSCRRRW
ncbi:MAG: RHS repeat domain-containing protein [Pirellulales bacterium]